MHLIKENGKYKYYGMKLILEGMSLQQALKVFGMNINDIDASTVKKKYKELSIKNHPDKGGSKEKMQDINLAYDILKNAKVGSTSGSGMSSEDEKSQNIQAAKIALANIKNRINIDEYKKYFSEFIKKDIKVDIDETNIKDVDNRSYDVKYNLNFYTEGKTTVFKIHLSMRLSDIKYNKGLGDSKVDFSIMADIEVYHDKRKIKMSKTDISFVKDKNFLRDPKSLFPENKLNKIFKAKTKKFTKKDATAVFERELDGITNNGFLEVPLGDGIHFLGFVRGTFIQKGYWEIDGLYSRQTPEGKKFPKLKREWYSSNSVIIWEHEDIFSTLTDLIKDIKKGKNLQSYISKTENALNIIEKQSQAMADAGEI